MITLGLRTARLHIRAVRWERLREKDDIMSPALQGSHSPGFEVAKKSAALACLLYPCLGVG